MDKDSGVKSSLTHRPAAVPRHATRDLVHARTRELALLSGRQPHDVSQADYEQAKREVTGESDADRQDAVMDVLSEMEALGKHSNEAEHEDGRLLDREMNAFDD